MIYIFPLIVILIGVATIIAIQFLPDVDKDFSVQGSLLVDEDCDLTAAMHELKLVNTLYEEES